MVRKVYAALYAGLFFLAGAGMTCEEKPVVEELKRQGD